MRVVPVPPILSDMVGRGWVWDSWHGFGGRVVSAGND